MVKVRLQTCWYLLFSLPSSWNLALVVAFVENLESTDWHLSSHSIGRTHPHRLGTVLANTTDTDIDIGSYSYSRYCMVKCHVTSSCNQLNPENPMNILLMLSLWYFMHCVMAALHVCVCMSLRKRERKSKWETEEERKDVMCLCVGEGWSYTWWAKPNSG